MAYIGREPLSGEVILLNSIESQFNGVLTTFNLTRTVNGVTTAFYPVGTQQLLVSLGGVIQTPDPTGNLGFRISYNTIIFAVAPLAGTSCFIVAYGNALDIGRPADNSVTSEKIASPGPTWDANGNVIINATGYIDVPVGTVAQRPGTPNSGMLRYNSEYQRFEGYAQSSWGTLGGAGGAGGDSVFYENDTNVTTNYSITSGKNAMSAGPITINNGATVTIPNGSVWTVV